MEALTRKPLQGVANIIRFNWHFYAIAFVFVSSILIFKNYLPYRFQFTALVFALLIITSTLISLIVSYYIYDFSNLYLLNWLNNLNIESAESIVNINAGFDETSYLLKQKFPNATFDTYDFYDKKKHTEISIERARKAYPAFPNTINISTNNVSLNSSSIDYIFLILAAHEIRENNERINFFNQLLNFLGKDGKIIVVEHQRDVANFFAFNIGFLHFYSTKNWLQTFTSAELQVNHQFKITPFISTFILSKNGTTS